jgi:glycosyltransferase involved in cell wall biosynthesis
MIAKDEEANLTRCLESVKGIVDEIIVVDTGSTDKTVDIAMAYGAFVPQIIWHDDFSQARNIGLGMARGQWILFLDADEELVKEDAGSLRAALENGDKEAYYLTLINFRGDVVGRDFVKATAVRVFRNRREYRFEGAIHEQILPIIEKHGGKAGVLDVRVNHYGYLNDQIRLKDKTNRNLRIIEAMMAKSEGDAFDFFNLGQECFRVKDYEQAFAAFKQSFEMCPDLKEQYAPRMMKNLAVCLGMLGKRDDALHFLKMARQIHPLYTDLHYLEGLLHLDAKQFKKAELSFRVCLEIGEPPAFYTSDDGVGARRAREYLKKAIEGQQSKHKKARKRK